MAIPARFYERRALPSGASWLFHVKVGDDTLSGVDGLKRDVKEGYPIPKALSRLKDFNRLAMQFKILYILASLIVLYL